MAHFVAKKIKTFNGDKKGVTMLEYGLIAALIAVVCVTAVTSVGTSISAKFASIASTISGTTK
ncbi:MAG: Flp family type IVb pilin [Rhodomicrobium sp.]